MYITGYDEAPKGMVDYPGTCSGAVFIERTAVIVSRGIVYMCYIGSNSVAAVFIGKEQARIGLFGADLSPLSLAGKGSQSRLAISISLNTHDQLCHISWRFLLVLVASFF